MALALSLARRGLGRTWPNPAVGCVVAQGTRVVGRGWTQPGGRPHAEAVALARAGTAATGGTAYVTLEPCAHHGKTPPCADAMIAAGLARVVVALSDPDPRVNGAGIDRLRKAGITVDMGVLRDQATALQAGFLQRITEGRPFLTLKLATSFDGRIATATGESQWITGPQARRYAHALRADHDAVLVGAGTARADDPQLTVRDLGVTYQPVRVVASRRIDVPLNGKLARTARETPVWICHGPDADPALVTAWQDLGALCLPTPIGPDRQIDPGGLMQTLAQQGLTRVFCEGGGAFAAALLNADVVDRLITGTAGLALGAEGQPAIGAMGLDRLAEARRYTLQEHRAMGPDIVATWHRA
ncbi:bifunctional diaminohydroxyphosphoribosylaminopyrimidine deaminase/5-amino-6-(5-phosphoribosylamino)uracil reductase RibD [Actibacterium sp. 188UL27-1]|nr:bifunctional diaminohydroxyphosphoribosylaminopyrimidine deaminase/5-amino-6-(5-phosphoribosylamino)uracil reductase RibD [Actibacterium sp. 188UL27-1]